MKFLHLKSVKLFMFCALGIIIYSFTLNNYALTQDNQYSAKIKNKKINIEIADSLLKRSLGLMNRDYLNPDAGMLFIFKPAQNADFWMKNVNFPLDLLFISNDKIVKIDEEVPPCINEPCAIYPSVFKVDYALEVNSGYCKKNNIEPGDNIIFNPNTKKFIENSSN